MILKGIPFTRILNVNEEVAFKNLLRSSNFICDSKKVQLQKFKYSFYRKLKLKTGGFYTTCSYMKSQKRINYFNLLNTGKFFKIESIMLFDMYSLNESACEIVIIFGRIIGTRASKLYAPSHVGLTMLDSI